MTPTVSRPPAVIHDLRHLPSHNGTKTVNAATMKKFTYVSFIAMRELAKNIPSTRTRIARSRSCSRFRSRWARGVTDG